jgi:PD-(D/E)XK endonuclease
MASLKTKGDLAELKVATDLLERGYRIAIPYGEDHDFDLILCRDDHLERVQVKYTESDSTVIAVKCYSHSLTNGRIRRTKQYTEASIDWLAVYDRTTNRCFYIPATELGRGRSVIHLRLISARNGQRRGVRFAEDYTSPEITRATFE